MWKIGILLLYFFYVVLAAEGDCVEYKKIETYIPVEGLETIRHIDWIPVKICCQGYQNIDGVCEPICQEACIAGRCVAPNECECDDGWQGDTCTLVSTPCEGGFWGTECLNTCDCNGSNCTITDGQCICQPGYIGDKCEIPCSSGTYGTNCSLSCNCLMGDCDRVTGHCSCYPGFSGTNCSTTCPVGKYGVNCNETCLCQNDSECDNRNGRCTCKPGFQGKLCEKYCSLGTWGADCVHSCDCDDASCDVRTGSCHCKPGYTGAQCTDFCEHDFCGENCSGTCNCENGKCSETDCTCICNEGWIGNNCNQTICGLLKYGANCSQTCYCNATNTETCDALSGNCICKAGWIGERCSKKCPLGTYGPGCNKTCFCNLENTKFCNNGICECGAGWTGQTCETPCEDFSYGVNCTSICWHFGLVNFICDYVRGEICNTNYEGENCEICKCEPNGWCNSTTGDCECNLGYYGNQCSESCPPDKYGENCESNCECENCRKSDGYCKCQEGFQGVNCSDYCPISFYNRTTGKCFINQRDGIWIPLDNLMYYVIGAAAGVLILVLTIIIIYIKCTKTKSDGMIDISAPKITLAPENIPSSNEYETEHDYDIIPERPPSYQRLIRPDEIHDRFQDRTYFTGYETPRFPQNVEMYNISPDYVRLDRNSVGPAWPANNDNNHYYTFRRPQL